MQTRILYNSLRGETGGWLLVMWRERVNCPGFSRVALFESSRHDCLFGLVIIRLFQLCRWRKGKCVRGVAGDRTIPHIPERHIQPQVQSQGASGLFGRWKDGLKEQRLVPCRKLSKLIEPHWEGLPPAVIQLGLVERINK